MAKVSMKNFFKWCRIFDLLRISCWLSSIGRNCWLSKMRSTSQNYKNWTREMMFSVSE